MFIEVQRYKLSLKHKNNQLINFQKREGFRDPLREGFIQTLPFCIPSIYTGSEAKTGGCEGFQACLTLEKVDSKAEMPAVISKMVCHY